MDKELVCRVIMLPDATVHIAFPSRRTIGCTANCLSEILGNPLAKNNRSVLQEESTNKVNPACLPLESIPGLTLLKIFSDAEVVCVFPKLFQRLFSNITSHNADEIIDLSDYVNDLENYDEKHLLMKFFHSFTNEFSLNTKVQVPLGLAERDKMEVLSETYHSSFLPFLDIDEVNIVDADSVELNPNYSPPSSISNGPSGMTLSIKEAALYTGYGESTLYKFIPEKLKTVTPEGVKPARISINEANRLKAQREEKQKSTNKLKKTDRKVLNKLSQNGIDSLRKKLSSYRGLSSEIIKFISSKDEYNYYCNNGYKEVLWDARRALIIDVDFDYVSSLKNISNAERMAQGKPPIVAGTDDIAYVIHHIGQEANSPFAIYDPLDHQKNDGKLHSKRINITYKINPFGKYEECISEDKHGANFKKKRKVLDRVSRQIYRCWKLRKYTRIFSLR